eukprot:scaffold12123_cov32-Tisochrysis_lutea.AAC.4
MELLCRNICTTLLGQEPPRACTTWDAEMVACLCPIAKGPRDGTQRPAPRMRPPDARRAYSAEHKKIAYTRAASC